MQQGTGLQKHGQIKVSQQAKNDHFEEEDDRKGNFFLMRWILDWLVQPQQVRLPFTLWQSVQVQTSFGCISLFSPHPLLTLAYSVVSCSYTKFFFKNFYCLALQAKMSNAKKEKEKGTFPKTNCFSFGHAFHGHNRNVYDKFKISN